VPSLPPENARIEAAGRDPRSTPTEMCRVDMSRLSKTVNLYSWSILLLSNRLDGSIALYVDYDQAEDGEEGCAAGSVSRQRRNPLASRVGCSPSGWASGTRFLQHRGRASGSAA